MYIYIASPYSLGDKVKNVEASLHVANALIDRGHVPFAPLLSHYWDAVTPRSYDAWLELDFAWIRRCDAILRLPRASAGADAEVALATQLGLPIYYELDAVPTASWREV